MLGNMGSRIRREEHPVREQESALQLLVQDQQAQRDTQLRKRREEEGEWTDALVETFRPAFAERLDARPVKAKTRTWVTDADAENVAKGVSLVVAQTALREGRSGLYETISMKAYPERADLRRWQGVTDIQRAQVAHSVTEMLHAPLSAELPREMVGQARGYMAALALVTKTPAADVAITVAKAVGSAGTALDALTGLQNRANLNEARFRVGLENKDFNTAVESRNNAIIEQRKARWMEDQLRDQQISLASAGVVLPLALNTGTLQERIKATTDFATGFLASHQMPGSDAAPSALDVMDRRRMQVTATMADPRVAPGYVVSESVKRSYDRFLGYYNTGNSEQIRNAVTNGQAAVRRLADTLGATPEQARALEMTAQHSAMGIFAGGRDAMRVALYADNTRALSVHKIDEFQRWAVGSTQSLEYAKSVQEAFTQALDGNLVGAEKELEQTFSKLPPAEAGAFFLAGAHPLAMLMLAAGQPKKVNAREYREWLAQLPEHPDFASPNAERTNAFVDAERRRLVQFGRNGQVRIYDVATDGALSRYYDGSVMSAPIERQLANMRQDAQNALNYDQVTLVEAIRMGYLSLDNFSERPIVPRLNVDSAISVDGYDAMTSGFHELTQAEVEAAMKEDTPRIELA